MSNHSARRASRCWNAKVLLAPKGVDEGTGYSQMWSGNPEGLCSNILLLKFFINLARIGCASCKSAGRAKISRRYPTIS